MNLRISEKQLRFRITKDELQQLLGGQSLGMVLPHFRTHSYTVKITDGQDSLSLKEDGQSWTLLVDRHALQALAEKLPSREGLCEEIQVAGQFFSLMLEIDVRKSPKT